MQTASLTGIKVSQNGEYAYNARETVSVYFPSLQIYNIQSNFIKFSFSQLLKYHICTAGQLTSLGPSCSSGCAAAAGWGALPASEPQAWGSSPPLCRRT